MLALRTKFKGTIMSSKSDDVFETTLVETILISEVDETFVEDTKFQLSQRGDDPSEE